MSPFVPFAGDFVSKSSKVIGYMLLSLFMLGAVYYLAVTKGEQLTIFEAMVTMLLSMVTLLLTDIAQRLDKDQ